MQVLRSLITSMVVLAGAGFATASAQAQGTAPADAAFAALMAEYERGGPDHRGYGAAAMDMPKTRVHDWIEIQRSAP
jgi:hypothetical protein